MEIITYLGFYDKNITEHNASRSLSLQASKFSKVSLVGTLNLWLDTPDLSQKESVKSDEQVLRKQSICRIWK